MLKDIKALVVLGILLLVCMFAAALTYNGNGAAASYLFNSSSYNTTPSFTAPKVNNSSYSSSNSGGNLQLRSGTLDRAYGNTTPTPQPSKKK